MFLFSNAQAGVNRHERHVHMLEAFVTIVLMLKSRVRGTHHKAVIIRKSIPRITYLDFSEILLCLTQTEQLCDGRQTRRAHLVL